MGKIEAVKFNSCIDTVRKITTKLTMFLWTIEQATSGRQSKVNGNLAAMWASTGSMLWVRKQTKWKRHSNSLKNLKNTNRSFCLIEWQTRSATYASRWSATTFAKIYVRSLSRMLATLGTHTHWTWTSRHLAWFQTITLWLWTGKELPLLLIINKRSQHSLASIVITRSPRPSSWTSSKMWLNKTYEALITKSA